MEDSQTDYGFEYSGKEYGDPPTSEEAQAEIGRVMKAAQKDPSHDYTNVNSLGHKAEVERVQKLFGIVKPEPEPLTAAEKEGRTISNQVQPDVAKAMQLAVDELGSNTEEIQEKLRAEFEEESSRMDELGFEPTRMPDKILPYQVRGLKEQRLFTEATEKENKASWEEFKVMIRQDFREMQGTPYAPNPQTLEILDRFLGEADISYLPTQRLSEALFRVIFEMRTPRKKAETD